MRLTCLLKMSAISIAALVPLIGDAEDYHVARNAANASDSNDGLAAHFVSGAQGPWLTVQHACYQAQAGDTIWIHNGDYRDEETGWGRRGTIWIDNSGLENSPIRIVAAPGPRPVLNAMRIDNKSWIEVEGLSFVNIEFSLPGNWVNMPNVLVDDPEVEIDTDLEWEVRELQVRKKYQTFMEQIQDPLLSNYYSGIDCKTSDNVVIRNNTFRLYTFGIQVRANSAQVLIENNTIKYCNSGIFTWQPLPAITDSVIRGNTISQCFTNGIQVREGANNVTIEENDIRYNGTSHISILRSSTNCTVRKNRCVYGGYYTETMVNPGSSAINIHTSLGGNIVEKNFAGFQVDSTGLDGNGFIVDLMLQESGVLLRNNVSYRNMGSGIRMVESPNCVVVNNTLAENGYQAVNPRGGSGVFLARDEDVDTTIANNIFYNNSSAGIKSEFTIENQSQIDHNLYYSQSGAPLIWDAYQFGQNAYHTLDEVRAETGYESNGIQAHPHFRLDRSVLDGRSPGLRSFRLFRASPAIDRGLGLPLVADDYDGISRPLGKQYDIGAFESR